MPVDPNNPDTTVAVQASAWLRIGEVLQEARDIIQAMVNWSVEAPYESITQEILDRADRWLDEYDAHQIPQQETPQ